jgi:dihydrofolate reductase
VSRQGLQIAGVEIIHDLRQLRTPSAGQKIFICGGAQLYAAMLPYCSDLFLTIVKQEYDGDVWMPPFEPRFTEVSLVWERPLFKIVHYHNAQKLPWPA